jgi:hypothetical protein
MQTFKVTFTNGWQLIEAKDFWAACEKARRLAKARFLTVTGIEIETA